MLTPQQQAALEAVAPLAVAAERATGFPAEATVAQWSVESGWGQRETGANNCWGLTRDVAPERPQAWCDTTERLTYAQIAQLDPDEKARVRHIKDLGDGFHSVDLQRRFPSFDSLGQALDCYVHLITTGHRYQGAWQAYQVDHSLDRLLTGIAKAGYATGAAYEVLLKQNAHGSHIPIAVQAARQRVQNA